MVAAVPSEGFLLDTHVAIWWQKDPTRISPAAAALLADPRRRLVVSVCTLWEIEIKRKLGKLGADPTFDARMRGGSIELLAIQAEHAVAAGSLALLHGDPFDRMLVAQAQLEGLTLVTADRKLAAYDVPILDAKPKRRR